VSWFNDFIGRFSQETKPRQQKWANIIDRLTPALEVWPWQEKLKARILADWPV